MQGADSVFKNAVWIGSPKPSLNTDILDTFEICAEFKITDGTKFAVAVCARDKENCLIIEGDAKTRSLTAYEYSDNTLEIRGSGKLPELSEEFNSIRITAKKHTASIFVNGRTVIDSEEIIPKNELNKPFKSFLMNIGLKQTEGSVVYKSLKISSPETNEVYSEGFSDESALTSLGTVKNGLLCVSREFNLINPVPPVNVRRFFDVKKPVKSARLICTARGFYEVFLNGERLGNEYFSPGFTDYRKRIYYQTYKLCLKEGSNSIGAIIAKGYYSGFVGYSGAEVYGKQSSFIARIDIEYTDGSKDMIVTDNTWQFTDKGHIINADFQQGEYLDARLKFDWNDINDKRWTKCAEIPIDPKAVPTNGILENERLELTKQDFQGAVVYASLSPVSASEISEGHIIYDFSQNLVGTIRISLLGKRGQTVKIRYGEMLSPDGSLYTENLRTAANTDVYVCEGSAEGETFEPSFTSHGFRYAEISGSGLTPDMIKEIKAVALTNVTSDTGCFECSNPDINKLQKNIEWGQRGNSLLVFTDCPQRNERMGWTGDIQVFAKTAAYNADIREFAKKWLLDLRDAQLMYNRNGAVPDTAPLGGDNRPSGGCGGWGDAAVIVPWEMYLAYGDISFLKDNYRMMKLWVDYQSTRENYGIRTVDGSEIPSCSDISDLPFIQVQQSRGDHLAYDESTPFILSATAYAAYSSKLLSEIAKILGHSADTVKYRRRFENIKQAFNSAWVDDDGGISYWGEQSKSSRDTKNRIINQTRYSEKSDAKPSQTAYALAIDFDLIPKEKLKKASEYFAESVKDNKLSVGFLGISHLIPALIKAGYKEKAFSLLEQTENPSWLYSVRNGATTIWERWNSYNAETKTFGDALMNSFNHYAYGAVGEWLFGGILGINTHVKHPGYKRIVLTPFFGGTLTYAKGFFKSPHGKITSEWRRENGVFYYRCEIPEDTSAELYLPGKAKCVSSDIKAYIHNGKSVFELVPGGYEFRAEI